MRKRPFILSTPIFIILILIPSFLFAGLNQYKYFHRGKRYLEIGEYDKAIQDFTRAIELEKNYVFAYAKRGMAWEMKGLHEKALEDYDKALEINPQYSIAYKYRALTWQNMGEYTKAMEDYNKTIEIDPEDYEAFYQIGCIYCKQKEKEDALKFLEMALKNGYSDFESIESNPVWNDIKNLPEFKELIQKYKQSASLQ